MQSNIFLKTFVVQHVYHSLKNKGVSIARKNQVRSKNEKDAKQYSHNQHLTYAIILTLTV